MRVVRSVASATCIVCRTPILITGATYSATPGSTETWQQAQDIEWAGRLSPSPTAVKVPASTRPWVTFQLEGSFSDIYSIKLWGPENYIQQMDRIDVILSSTANFTTNGTLCQAGVNLVDGVYYKWTTAGIVLNGTGYPITVLCPPVANAAYLTLVRKSGSSTTEGLAVDEIEINRGGRSTDAHTSIWPCCLHAVFFANVWIHTSAAI